MRYDQAGHFGWGVSLYPSGNFTLWRKHEEKTVGFEEAFVSAFTGLNRGRTADEVSSLYGAETVQQYWEAAPKMDVPGLRSGAVHTDDAVVDLGLSMSLSQKKIRRGLGGLTSHGATLVRECAWGLQESYGREHLGFWTVTLPRMTPEDYRSVCANWSKITENVKKKLQYHLRRAGLPDHVLGVTELQEERWLKEKCPAWHLHILFVGRKPGSPWLLDMEMTDKLWREAVEQYCSDGYSWRSSCQLERVRKSAANYMGKYMSKGGRVIQEVEEKWPGAVPSAWYICTKGLRDWLTANTRRSEATARWIYQLMLDTPEDLTWLWSYDLPIREGVTLPVCWKGGIDPFTIGGRDGAIPGLSW